MSGPTDSTHLTFRELSELVEDLADSAESDMAFREAEENGTTSIEDFLKEASDGEAAR